MSTENISSYGQPARPIIRIGVIGCGEITQVTYVAMLASTDS